jgi:tetratricopeptide (TPR) repeat protein
MLIISVSLVSQESKLANEYYRSGEYEKAGMLYKKLHDASKNNDFYFTRYLESLLALEQFDDAEKAIREEINKRPDDAHLYVSYGNIFEKKYEPEKAEEQYGKAIKKVKPDLGSISRLGNAFLSLAKYDQAIQVYELATNSLDNKYIFAYNLADLYRRKGTTDKMIQYYLLSLLNSPNRTNSLKNLFQRYLAEEEYDELQRQLYIMIQDHPDEVSYPELLQWVFIQRKEYGKALRQARAMDRKYDENGSRVYEIGSIAQNAQDYDAAIEAFQYIIDNKGPNTRFYISSKLELLDCKRKKVTRNFDHSEAELQELESEYESFLTEFGKNSQTIFLVKEYAKFQALYLNNIDKAINLLEEVKSFAGVTPEVRANVKIDLGDYYLIKGDIWEATLLYSQVDKAFKEGVLGERARYRNSMLSYYNGDFEWAQQQFDILKAATSKLISNDAIDMSVFIMDNLGLDTTAVPLQLYAQAELMVYQNRYEEAFEALNKIENDFPGHGLKDDLMYIKAQIHKRKKEYTLAETFLQAIITDHKEEIRCDNAMMELAEMYQNILGETEKAKDLYERIFLEFSDSTFAVEARKRFRILRGDEIQ